LSDDEEDDGGRRETLRLRRSGNIGWDGAGRYEREEAEEMVMWDTARVARESRKRV
jgi:hypothetical protein